MIRITFFLALAVAVQFVVLEVRLAGAELTAKGVEFFEQKIRPVLVQRCYSCHSASSKDVKGGLLLDTRDGIRTGGEGGAAVIPGNPEESLLLQAIKHESLEMPPNDKLPDDVIFAFEQWIEMGAPDPRTGKAPSKAKINLAEARNFWSFKRPVRTNPPSVNNSAWPRNDIDHFVLAKLEEKGLKPVGDADRFTLLRRVTYDLTGLPPTPDEIAAFTAPNSKQTVADVVNRLLESPQFGERWGRHWLDVARYGESTGKERNVAYGYAWRYRNYVIDAFNKDKPYDRFIREQVAGDLIVTKNADERNENLTATGFLAIGTKSINEKNAEQYRMDVTDEMLDTTTRAFIGMTVACARCHDHKFDPITANDYYAMAGIFRSTDILAGVKRGNNKTGYDGEHAMLVSTSGKIEFTESQKKELARLTEEIRDAREKLGQINVNLRNGKGDKKKKLQEAQERLEKRIQREESEIKQLRENPGASHEPVMAVRDVSKPDNCRVNIRGEVKELGPEIPRGLPVVLSFDRVAKFDTPQSGRMQLASWLTSKENPLTARVMVNRVWAHLLGVGLVDPVDNFGTLGEEPTHPELLDLLAIQFVEQGWSVKKLIRSIMLSRTYQMSSEHSVANYEVDPDNHLVWRMNRRRLEAEAIRDSLLAVSGRLDPYRPEGSPVIKMVGDEIGRKKDKKDKGGPSVAELTKVNTRSVYVPLFRSAVPELLSVFDMADPSLMVPQREVTTVATQALFMMNSPFVMENATAAARRVLTSTKSQDQDRLDHLFLLVLNRPPTATERTKALAYVGDYEKLLAEEDGESNNRKVAAWTSLCQTLFASGEFRYVY